MSGDTEQTFTVSWNEEDLVVETEGFSASLGSISQAGGTAVDGNFEDLDVREGTETAAVSDVPQTVEAVLSVSESTINEDGSGSATYTVTLEDPLGNSIASTGNDVTVVVDVTDPAGNPGTETGR